MIIVPCQSSGVFFAKIHQFSLRQNRSNQEEAPVAAPVQVLPPETLLAAGASKASAPAPPGEAGGADPSTAPAMAAMPGAAMPGAGFQCLGAAAAAAAMMPGGDPFDLKRPGKHMENSA